MRLNNLVSNKNDIRYRYFISKINLFSYLSYCQIVLDALKSTTMTFHWLLSQLDDSWISNKELHQGKIPSNAYDIISIFFHTLHKRTWYFSDDFANTCEFPVNYKKIYLLKCCISADLIICLILICMRWLCSNSLCTINALMFLTSCYKLLHWAIFKAPNSFETVPVPLNI